LRKSFFLFFKTFQNEREPRDDDDNMTINAFNFERARRRLPCL